MQIGGPAPAGVPSSQIGTPPMGGGTLPAGLPPTATMGTPSAPGGSDRQIASTAAQHLLEATAQVHDPMLKAAFSTALSALHKYLAGVDKEHQQALSGKLSPRLMQQAHGVHS